MNTQPTATTSKTTARKDEFDVSFDFEFKFGLTDYALMFLYLLLVLPFELAGRIVSDCYGAYQAKKANAESMRTLFVE